MESKFVSENKKFDTVTFKNKKLLFSAKFS